MNDLQILHNNIDNRSVSKAVDTITKIATKELLLPEELFDPHEDSRIGENRSANNVAFVWPTGGEPKIELPDYIPADANLLKVYIKYADGTTTEPSVYLNFTNEDCIKDNTLVFLNHNISDACKMYFYAKSKDGSEEWYTENSMIVGNANMYFIRRLCNFVSTTLGYHWVKIISDTDNSTVIGYFRICLNNN